jgi:maleylacetoacetate isomerase
MITLFDYWRSSAAYRVRIALNHLGLQYASVAVDLLTGAHRTPDNLARNPQGLVPTLIIDGQTLTQSLAIVEYLQDTRGGLLPTDAPGRARVRAIAHAIAMEVAPVANLTVRNRIADLAQGRITADDWQREVIMRGFAGVEAMLEHPATGVFCHGNALSMADLCLVPQVYNAERVGLDMAAFPRITAVTAALRDLPALAAAHPDRVRP